MCLGQLSREHLENINPIVGQLLRRSLPFPRLNPFDLSIRLDYSLDPAAWRTAHFSRIGFDVTLIHFTKPSTSTSSEAAKYTESDLRPRDRERITIEVQTNSHVEHYLQTNVIGEIIHSKNALIPIAVGPHGDFGSLFC
jgi:hypothetical protein